jgi:hypothetical protein
LNPSMYIGMEFLNVIGFVLACHGLHNSILLLFSPVAREIFRKNSANEYRLEIMCNKSYVVT